MNKIDRRRKGVLILECDSDKLSQDDLALGIELLEYAQSFFPRNPIDLVQSFSEADLLENLAALFEAKQSYKNVVIIGHSNREGLKLSTDRFISWEGVANWISPFAPHRIMLLACEGGRWLPCSALFDGIPSLKEIFGSPIPVYKDQRYSVLVRVLYILGVKKEDPDFLSLLQFANLLLTKGLMVQKTRSEYEDEGFEEGTIWNDLTESFITEFFKQLRS
jgi:hypothetical protein